MSQVQHPAQERDLFTLAQYRGQTATLFIQSKGLHSGRPLVKPIANCFALTTDHPHAFALCFAAYTAKRYRVIQRGSCIPFVTLADTRVILEDYLRPTPDGARLILEQVDAVQALLRNLEQRRKTLEQYRHALCSSLTSKL